MGATLNVKAVAEAVSTIPKDSPPPKPGVSALFVFGKNDPVLPYDGGLQGWFHSFQSFKTNYSNLMLDWTTWRPFTTSRPSLLDQSAPYRLFPDYVAANGLHIGPTTSTPYFDKTVAGPNLSGVKVVRYLFNDPYGGHSWPGRATGGANETENSASNGTPAPSYIFDMPHVAACFFKLRQNHDCISDGVRK